jgi:para-nitrobenzyl esterase
MLLALLSAASSVASVSSSPTVLTNHGELVGVRLASGVTRFGNLPFADAPIGLLRFARAKLASLGVELDATTLAPPCIQNPLGDPRDPASIAAGLGAPTEDCLRLNVWAPPGAVEAAAAADAAPLPVLVYIFGGGLCGGFASNAYYSGAHMAAAENVIVVSVSYRIGALGFLPFDAATAGFDGGGSGGMNGIHDIVVALEWIRVNIARFGGAPSGVTLFGQSSGSYAICNICVAPKAKGLFDKAVLHSGPCVGGPPGKGWGPGNATLARQVRTSIFKTLNVSTIAELRAIKNASSIQWPDHVMNDADAAPFFSGYFPDAFVIPTTTGLPRELWAKGAINPSALIVSLFISFEHMTEYSSNLMIFINDYFAGGAHVQGWHSGVLWHRTHVGKHSS